MKRIAIAVLIGFFAAPLPAVEPVSIVIGKPESRYALSHGNIEITSYTVTTVEAVTGYRKLIVSNLLHSSTVYYKVDGSTQNILTSGFPIAPHESNHEIETNQDISFQVQANGIAQTLRKIEIRK